MILRDVSVLYRCANMFYQANSMDGHKLAGIDPAILMYVSKNNSIGQDNIIKYLMTDRATVTKSIDRLEKAGYFIRKTDERDRRANIVEITQDGICAAKHFQTTMHSWMKKVMENFTEEEKLEFEKLCGKACSNAWHHLKETSK